MKTFPVPYKSFAVHKVDDRLTAARPEEKVKI